MKGFPRARSRAVAAAALVLAVIWTSAYSTEPETASDRTLVVLDGDTLVQGGQVLELAGIDAPELGQWCHDGAVLYACGVAAAFELKKLLALDPVTCAAVEGDGGFYECLTPRGSVSELLAEMGLVVARDGTGTELAQQAARAVPLGIWRGRFVDPARWRQGERLPDETEEPHRCPILAWHDAGAGVFVVPTDPDYRTWEGRRLGMQHFCSDDAALAAGYAHRGASVTGAAPAPPAS